MRLSWPFRRAQEGSSAKPPSTVAPMVQRAPLEEWRDLEPSAGLSGPPGLTADPQFGRSLTGHRSLPPVLQHVARGGQLAPLVESTEGRPPGSGREGISSRTEAATRSYRRPQRSVAADAAGSPEPAGLASDETMAPDVSLPAAPIPSRVAPKGHSAQGSTLPRHALTVLPDAQRSAIEQDTVSSGQVLLSRPLEPSAHLPQQGPTTPDPIATAGPGQAAAQTAPVAPLPGGSTAASTQHMATPSSRRPRRHSLGRSRRAGLGSPLPAAPSPSHALDSTTALGDGPQRSPAPEEMTTVSTAVGPAVDPEARRLSANEQRSRTELDQVDDRPASAVPTPTARGNSSGGPVRIDRSQGAASAAAELGANAFTSGDTIVMPSSHGPLDSGRGQALLAHELVHVGQQRSMGSSLPAEHTAAGQDLEREAQSAESFVEQGRLSGPPATGPGAAASESASFHLPMSHTPSQPAVPAPQRSARSSSSSSTPNAAATDTHDDIDEVSRRVYERIRLRLRRELLLDRERGGYLTDPR